MCMRLWVIIIALFLFFSATALTPWIHGNDGAGYFAPVRSAIIDGDLDLSDEYEHFAREFTLKSIRADVNTGRYFSQYPIGTALLWTPFYLTAHVLAPFLGYVQDGYSFPYVFAICFASALYGLFGLLMGYAVLKKFFKEKIVVLSLVTVWLASSLFYYMFFEASLSHATSMFATSLIVYFWFIWREKLPTYGLILGGMCFGLAALIRYQNVIFLWFPLIELIMLWRSKKVLWLFKRYLAMATGFILVLFPQLILLAHNHGTLVPQYSGYFQGSLVLGNFLNVLFSWNHGVFSWTPVLFLGLLGLLFYFKKNKQLALTFFLIFASNVFLISGWTGWNGAQSFGHRMFINMFFIFAFGFCFLLEQLEQKVNFKVLLIGCLALIGWNFNLMIQYGTRMISVDGPVHISEMLSNSFELPGKLFGILKKFLFSRGSYL